MLVWVADGRLRLVSCFGPRWADCERPPEELAGAEVSEVFETDRAGSSLIAAHRRALQGETVCCRFRLGSQSYRGSIGPQRDAGGEIVGCVGFARTATRGGRADELLRRQDDVFRVLADGSPAGIYLTDASGDCIYVNRRWREMAGLAPDEVGGRGWVKGIHPEDRAMVAERWYGMVSSGGEWGLEYRMQTPNGRTTWVYGQAAAIHDADGQLVGYVGTNADITDRKRAEDLLRQSEQRYRQLISAVTAYTYSVRLENGTVVSTKHSAGCVSATGYTPDEYAQDPSLWINMVHPDDREIVRKHAAKMLAGDPVGPIEHRIVHKRGTVRWVRNTVVPRHDASGVLVRYDGVVEDITDRKRVEQRFRRLLESAPEAMVIVDRHGKIVLVNAETERLFGYDRNELLGRTIELLVPERLRQAHIAHRSAYAASPGIRPMAASPELAAIRRDGSEFPAEIALSPIETEEGLLTSAAIRDVTARKRAEEEIRTNLQVQTVIGSLLRSALEPVSLDEFLGRTLDMLLSVPWIALKSKGSIFLVEEDSQALVLKAQRGLPEGLLVSCARVPFGRCLCGRAASTRKIVFADCLDERHETRCPGMLPHGHYCVPIVFEDRLLGVINLYLEQGHKADPREEAFLAAVADALAGTIRRKQAEEALQQSEERFDLAVGGTDAGIWDWDVRANRVYFSTRWKSMLGCEEDEITDSFSEWEGRLHPEDRDRALATVQSYLEGRTPEYELEHRLRHKDGSYRWILARGAAVRDGAGKPYRMVGSHIDVTARKLAEQSLRQRDAQLIAAQKIQEHLLPQAPPVVPGYDIDGASYPAEFAAGDHFDYLAMRDGSIGIVIGDVSGHGFSSALLMASTSAYLRSYAEACDGIDDIVSRTNFALGKEVEKGRFVTLIVARLDPRSRNLSCVNAGHRAAYVMDRQGRVKARLESMSLPLAILPDTQFPVGDSAALDPGDMVLFITDGVVEAMSAANEPFGTERMLEVARNNRDKPAREIIQAIHAAVCDFLQGEPLRDDVTAVVVKVEPALDRPAGEPRA